MNLSYWSVLISILFPYIFTLLAKSGPGFDNHNPRAYLESTTGWRKRAHYIQLNSFEIMPAFIGAVIIAHLMQRSSVHIDKLSITFVMTRVLYAACYLGNYALVRSLFWALGMGCIVGLFFIH